MHELHVVATWKVASQIGAKIKYTHGIENTNQTEDTTLTLHCTFPKRLTTVIVGSRKCHPFSAILNTEGHHRVLTACAPSVIIVALDLFMKSNEVENSGK